MKILQSFRDLTKAERRLWMLSLLVVTAAFLFSPQKDILNWLSSLFGVTALIFVAKGYVLGQLLTVVFSVFYGFIAFHFRYYGEMLTYLGMTAPIALMAVISWMRHPFRETSEVEVAKMCRRDVGIMWGLAAAVTVLFYFILKALGNANLLLSTFSVTTSFLASYMTMKRSPFYGLGYAANDLVLIGLWTAAAWIDPGCWSMVSCFVMFFCNDMYGFYNWQRMKKRQKQQIEKRVI